jgi:uncharacterized protein (DUF1800 family)
MLLYLDQAQSIGPGSRAGARAQDRQLRGRGLNENLAREILELHTLGVRSGYTQEDVTEFARALTGWTLPADDMVDGATATFRFVPALHEPGARTLLGRSYAEGGEQQARDIIHALVTSPATARHIAHKLARHFVADEPPPALVERLANAFSRTGGDLASVYRGLVASPEAWQPGGSKFKSPWDWAISTYRALGRNEMPAMQSTNLLTQLGQPVWRRRVAAPRRGGAAHRNASRRRHRCTVACSPHPAWRRVERCHCRCDRPRRKRQHGARTAAGLP